MPGDHKTGMLVASFASCSLSLLGFENACISCYLQHSYPLGIIGAASKGILSVISLQGLDLWEDLAARMDLSSVAIAVEIVSAALVLVPMVLAAALSWAKEVSFTLLSYFSPLVFHEFPGYFKSSSTATAD